MRNSICQQYHRNGVVSPTKIRGKVLTTAAVDNIDYNPSATAMKDSFPGTGISLMKHLFYSVEEFDRSTIVTSITLSGKFVRHLAFPKYHANQLQILSAAVPP